MSRERREERRRRFQESAQEPDLGRRRLLVYGVPAATLAVEEAVYGFGRRALAGIANRFSGTSYVTFEEAKRDPGKREQYVKDVVRRFGLDNLPYVERVYYSELQDIQNASVTNIQMSMSTDFIIGDIGKGKKHSIQVYKEAFDPLDNETESDFLSGLIDHETEGHARSVHFGFEDLGGFKLKDFDFISGADSKIPYYFLTSISELSAYKKQVSLSRQRGTTQRKLNAVRVAYMQYYSLIMQPALDDLISDKSVLRRCREVFFDQQVLTSPIEATGYPGGTPLMPEGKLRTTHGIIELPDYLKAKAASWEK